MNKSWLFFVLITVSVITLVSCNDDDSTDLVGDWVRQSDFEGSARTEAFCFTIGDTVYVGLGYRCYSSERDSTCRRYDVVNGWRKMASFPGRLRVGAVGFSIGNLGYVGTGDDQSKHYYSDFWEYNPNTDTWTQRKSLPVGRTDGVAFSLGGGVGYLGCGLNGEGELNDFYKYTPGSGAEGDSGTWESINACPWKLQAAVSFEIGSKAYVCTGKNSSSNSRYLVSFDGTTWEKLRNLSNTSDDSYDDDYTTLMGSQEAAFASSTRGYIMNGSYVWEYNPDKDLWTQKTSFEGTSRYYAIAFSVNSRLFFGLGGSTATSSCLGDIWEFKPDEEYDDSDADYN